ncbi:sorbitol dehydrogenase [Candidatus Aerophobetes bacterium]|uniref:Sorbitol dehydrogenase n=1 Tax=Aerophobetes bacterium TaxID=2030807 RepID=A0A662DC96_UNCAE|nr:MAG: sorbitol dehydrogenase [Candidatus Aerophobetes bacterium]
MKAVVKVKKGEGNIEVKDVEEPEVGPDEVKIEVKAAGICGTDIHIYHDEFMVNPPVILGHEFCGVVKEVGKNVTEFKVGERVTSETAARVCGKCMFCRTGNYNLCPERLGLGYGVNGAFTRFCVVRKQIVHHLPDNVDFISGALCEPLSCAVHGVIEKTGVEAGEVVVVIGPGPLGLLSSQISKVEGGFVVVMGLSIDGERLSLAKKLGADVVVDIEKENPEEIIKDLTMGYGADIVLECSGSPSGANLGLKLIRKKGKFTQMGLFGRPIEIDFEQIAYKELKVTGFFSHNWTSWEKALKLLEQGKVQTKPLVTEKLPITEWKKGFDKKEKGEGIKTILYPVK